MLSAMYSARAWCGGGVHAAEVTKMLPSTIKRFFTSWLRPQEFTTERFGVVAHAGSAEQVQPP